MKRLHHPHLVMAYEIVVQARPLPVNRVKNVVRLLKISRSHSNKPALAAAPPHNLDSFSASRREWNFSKVPIPSDA
jgi:hypothetical protein